MARLRGVGEYAYDDASYGEYGGGDVPTITYDDTVELPSASGPSNWEKVIGQAVSVYGQIRTIDGQIEREQQEMQYRTSVAQQQPYPYRYPLSPQRPGYSPFPGLSTGGGGFMGIPTPILLAVAGIGLAAYIYTQR